MADNLAALALSAPAGTYRKTVLRPGRWVTPAGRELNVTPALAQKLAGTFERMTAAGLRVPIYASTHAAALADTRSNDPARVASNCVGWITAAGVGADGSLTMDHQFSDDEAATVAKRARDVSVCIEPRYRSGAGDEYGDAVTHVLLTAEPVVSGQDEFAEIAACLVLSRAAEPNEEEAAVDLAKIVSALGLTAEADEAAVLAKISELSTPAAPAPAQAPAPVLPPEASAPSADAAARLSLAREITELELDKLVVQKALLPAAAEALKPVLLGDADKPAAAMLSASEPGAALPARAILAALAANAPAPPTGPANSVPPNSIALSHTTPDGAVTDERAAEIAAAIVGE